MATYRGTDGSLSVGGNAVGELQSWQITTDRPEIDKTAMGASSSSYDLDIVNWTATAVVNFDYGDTAQAALVDQALSGTVPTPLAGIFTVNTGKTLSGNVLVRGATIAAQRTGGNITLNLNLRGTGGISTAWA